METKVGNLIRNFEWTKLQLAIGHELFSVQVLWYYLVHIMTYILILYVEWNNSKSVLVRTTTYLQIFLPKMSIRLDKSFIIFANFLKAFANSIVGTYIQILDKEK